MCSPPAIRSLISSRVFSPPAEICRLGASDEDGEVVADSQRIDDVVGDEDDGDAPLACLQNDTQNVSRLFDPRRFFMAEARGATASSPAVSGLEALGN
jgi:hypothetical protein